MKNVLRAAAFVASLELRGRKSSWSVTWFAAQRAK